MIYKEFKDIDIDNCINVFPVRKSTLAITQSLSLIQFRSVLEIGVGTGFTSIYLTKMGYDVEGTDIDKAAIACAEKNANKNNLKINFIHSDLFAEVINKYDLLIFNPPVMHFDSYPLNKLLNLIKSLIPVSNKYIWMMYYSLFNSVKLKLIHRFMKDARYYLNNDGKIVLLQTKNEIELLSEIYGFKYRAISTVNSTKVILIEW